LEERREYKEEDIKDREISTHIEQWDVGSKLPKSEIVYFCQMIVVCHHRHVDRQPIATKWEKRTVDHLTQQCHRIRPTQSHTESDQTIREEEGASRFESW
jgi:hypothetical protein